MKRAIVVGLAAPAMAIALLTVVNMTAAGSAGPSEVADTVATLEADGYNVIVNGAGILSGCTVTAVRPGAPTIADTVYVDVAC